MKRFEGLFASMAPRALGVAAALVLMAGVAHAATTISTNIATGGTVTSVGVSSSGDVAVGGLSTTTAASGNIATRGTLTVGTSGSPITSMLFGTCTITPGAIVASASTTASCTAAGVASGDKVFVQAPSSVESWLLTPGASATTNAITITIQNASSTATVTGATRTWSWMAVR